MEQKTLEIIEETVQTLGYELVESYVNYGKQNTKIKVVIYKNDANISHEDCNLVSRVLRKQLELEELFPDKSLLIVESPGVERNIKEKKEYEIFKDKDMRIIIKNPEEYQRKDNVFIGRWKGSQDDWLYFENSDSELKIREKDIAKANLYFDINKYL